MSTSPVASLSAVESISFNTKFLVFNTKPLVFNTKFPFFNTNVIIVYAPKAFGSSS